MAVRRLLVFAIACLALVLDAAHAEDPEDRVSALVAQLGAEHAVTRARAAEALGRIDANAVPALVAALKDEDKRAELHLARLAHRRRVELALAKSDLEAVVKARKGE